MWPFTKSEKIETRQASSFTDAITSAIISQASGNLNANPLSIAALEMAAGAYARAFAGATVEGSDRVKQAVTSGLMGLMGRDLIRRGESILLILTDTGELELVPAGSWNITGHGLEDDWEYQVYIYSPSGSMVRVVSASSVIHCKYSYDPGRPWLGLSPLAWATSTGLLAANLEERLSQETGTATGYVLPMPVDSAPKTDETGPLDGLRKDLPNLKGKIALVETTAAGLGEGRQAAPMQDWQSKRIGADPPEVLAVLRSDVGMAVLGACGVNPALFDATGSSQGQREAYRQFINASVMPLAKMVSEELSKKLETEVSLNFTELQAHDMAARAGSFKKLVESGMPLEKAANISGIMSLETE